MPLACLTLQVVAVLAIIGLRASASVMPHWFGPLLSGDMLRASASVAPPSSVLTKTIALQNATLANSLLQNRPHIPSPPHLDAFARFLTATGRAKEMDGIDVHLIRTDVVAELHARSATPVETLETFTDASLAALANSFGAVASIRQHMHASSKPRLAAAARVAATPNGFSTPLHFEVNDAVEMSDESGRSGRILRMHTVENDAESMYDVAWDDDTGSGGGELVPRRYLRRGRSTLPGVAPRVGLTGSAAAVARIRGIDLELARSAPLRKGEAVLTRHIDDSAMTLWLRATVLHSLNSVGGSTSASSSPSMYELRLEEGAQPGEMLQVTRRVDILATNETMLASFARSRKGKALQAAALEAQLRAAATMRGAEANASAAEETATAARAARDATRAAELRTAPPTPCALLTLPRPRAILLAIACSTARECDAVDAVVNTLSPARPRWDVVMLCQASVGVCDRWRGNPGTYLLTIRSSLLTYEYFILTLRFTLHLLLMQPSILAYLFSYFLIAKACLSFDRATRARQSGGSHVAFLLCNQSPKTTPTSTCGTPLRWGAALKQQPHALTALLTSRRRLDSE